MSGALIFLILMFFIYSCLIFRLVDPFLDQPRIKKQFHIPAALINTFLAATFTLSPETSAATTYLVAGIILFLNFTLLFKDTIYSYLFCTLACTTHLMAIRSVCVAIFSLATGRSMFEIVNTPSLLILTTSITFLFLNVVVLCVIHLVPPGGIRIINQHKEQLFFMLSWLSVFGVYLLLNAKIYSTPATHPDLPINQIAAPLAILIGTYIIVYFAIKTGELLGYKEKTEALEHTVEKERQYRTTIDRTVHRVIEVNFTKGEVVTGFEDYGDTFGNTIHDYHKMLEIVIRTTVHAEDRNEFIKYVSPQAIIQEFEAGTTEISFDYRRLVPENNYVWMHVLLALMRDPQTNEIKGFIQIRDIDAEKKQKIELQYKAERDFLTGLYNKNTTELLISEQLNTARQTHTSGVLYIIDIDNFKTVNDRLGHLYGDAVLSELSESLRKIFRDCDIVGRIGGDEFLVYATGLQNESMIISKAKSICDAFSQTYANERNEGYTVSGSVGITLFPKDGDNFETLFRCADTALYTTKAQGKNGYSFYNENLQMPYVSTRTEIDTRGIVQKSFKDNRIEYVFRLLYGSEDTKAAIESALELIAKNFGFSRANIFEFNELSTHFNGVFEWCAAGIASVSANYIDMPVKSFDFVVSALEKSGGMFMAVPTDFPESAQESYTSIGIKSIVHFSIMERDNLIGVIAFQHCVSDSFYLSDTAFEELRTICQVLSVFMSKRLSSERELRHHQAIRAMMDNMNCISYVVDRETYEVYYENQNTMDITGHPSIGMKCYHTYRGYDTPCEDCPLSHLSEEKPRCTLELYTTKFRIYTKTSAALIGWSNDRDAMLISSVDITEYKTGTRR